MYNFDENYIREAAYYIWKNNGCKQGTALSDWNEAIHQLSINAAFSTKTSYKKSTSSSKKTSSASKKTLNVKSLVMKPVVNTLKNSSKTK